MSDKDNSQNPDSPDIQDLIPFTQAAQLSGFTDRHLRKLAANHEIWAVKLGRNWFTTQEAISDYLAKNRKPGPKSQKGD